MTDISAVDQLNTKLSEYSKHFEEVTHADNTAMNSRAKKLTLKSLRRYLDKTELSLDRDLTLIYAPNGVGKSSLVDALDLLAKNETTRRSKSNFQKVETKDEKTLPSWNRPPADMGIHLEFKNGASLAYGSLKEESSSETIVSKENKYQTISRYSIRDPLQINKGDRFKQIFALLNIEGLTERTEDLKNEYEDQQADLQDIKALKAQVLAALNSAEVSLDALSVFIAAPEDSARLEARTRATRLRQKIEEELLQLAQIDTDLTTLDCSFNAITPGLPAGKRPSFKDGELEAIKALHSIVKEDDDCPFCASTKVTSEILETVSNLLATNLEWVVYDEKLTKFHQDKKDWARRVNPLKVLREKLSKLSLSQELRESYSQALENPLDDLDPFTARPAIEATRDSLLTALKQHQSDLEEQLDNAKTELSSYDPENSDALRRATALLGGTPEDQQAQLDRILSLPSHEDALKKWNTSFQKAQKTITASALEPIKKDILDWWKLMAPSHTGFEIEIDINSSGTPAIDINCVPPSVAGSEGKPHKNYIKSATGHLSDSQLDILALAIIFANHQRQFGNGFLWLDDPSDMFDESTTKNFFNKAIPKLINNGIQVIVATHSRRIVQDFWASVGDARTKPDFERQRFAKDFKQINLDIESVDNTDQLDLSRVLISPFNMDSARQSLDEIHNDVKEFQNRWTIGHRLRLANAIRRYAEIALAEFNHAAESLLTGAHPTQATLIGDPKATFGHYYKESHNTVKKLQEITMSFDANNPGLQHVKKLIDRMLSILSKIQSTLLNEGSHASATIPTYDELQGVLNDLDDFIKPDQIDRSSGIPTLKKLNMIYPSGAFHSEWESARANPQN